MKINSPLQITLSFALLVGFAAACGKRSPPLPPIERVQQRTESLSGIQRGNQVILSWPAPRRNAPDPSVQSIRRIDVYRLAEKPRAPLALTEDEFAARSTLIGSVTYDQIKNALRRNAEIDAGHITVEAVDGKVTLKGKVRSWTERKDAETTAWAAPGVTQVVDRIEIGV